MGKTAFALNIAQNVAIRARKPVAIFSLEMGAESLARAYTLSRRLDSHRTTLEQVISLKVNGAG